MRRFLNKRTLLIASGILALAVLSAVVGIYLVVNSQAFNDRIRQAIIQEVEAQTGAEVSLASVRWNFRQQRIVLEDLTLRGTEPLTDPPLAHIKTITADVSLRNFAQRKIELFEVQVQQPRLRLLVSPDGRTNLPGPPKRPDNSESRFSLSIDKLKVSEGSALVNERRMNIDFTLSDIVSNSSYRSDTQILSATLAYSGLIARVPRAPIPYTLSSDFDFTRGTIVVRRAAVTSGKSSLKLQGRIDRALTADLSSRLEYTGDLDTAFVNHFFPRERVAGISKVAGSLEFAANAFSTDGSLTSNRADLNGWSAAAIQTKYAYRYPEKQLALKQLTAKVLGGSAQGGITVSPLPGATRVALDLQYSDVDGAQLARVYPWDPKYVIYSRLSGELQGWFEGAMERFEFSGSGDLTSYAPKLVEGSIALPATGTVSFVAKPSEVEVLSSDVRFFDTVLQADGRVHATQSALNVRLKSSDLANLFFLYKNANGEGSFEGTLTGGIHKPLLTGNIVLDRHKHDEWTIQHAEGTASLNTQTEAATLTNVTATIGQSTLTVSGSTNLDGSGMNLRLRSARVQAQDFASVLKEKVEGILSGDVTVTSINPMKVQGRVAAAGLNVRGRTFERMEGDLKVVDTAVEVDNLALSERGARLTDGKIRFNTATQQLSVDANVSTLNLNRVRELGIPETLDGIVQRAHVTLSGTLDRPLLGGDATIENLSFRGEVFPRAQLRFSTEWPYLTANLTEARNVDLSARIDLSNANYPFQATARFRDYSLEKVARFSSGALTASGDAILTGALRGNTPMTGTGTIREVHVRIEDYPFDGLKPFAISFDANQLKLVDEATLDGPRGTRMNIKGSVGLTATPELDLEASGNLDLRVLAEFNPSLSITGIVHFRGGISGTTERPNMNGSARFENASLGHEGIYTTLSAVNGDVRFNENRVTFENLEGRAGGGTIRIRGSGIIQNSQMEGLNVRLEADRVRFRYPAGLRSVVTGALLLGGTSSEPLLDGNLTVDSMTFRSEFEPFLAVFRPGGLDSGGTVFDRLRLSVHVSGNRNVSIQNELTEISGARIDLDIKGTLGSPSLTGLLEVNEGTLLFQGKRYDITRGNINFVDPLRIDPVIDIQAESDLRDYRVILSVSGRGDNVRVELRSDPPLPQLELVSLVAGGRTRRELEETGADKLPTSEELFQGGAVSVMVDLLRSKLGNRFDLLGLDRVRIDPYIVGAGNSSAQITLALTRDLSLTYSQDLSSNQQRVLQVEYFLSKNISFVASREDSNEAPALGFDIRLRKRF